jgi:hypothetical protein
MSCMVVVKGNRLILERVKMGDVMYLLCARRLALDGSYCFVVVMEEVEQGLRAEGEPFMLLVFSG